MKKIILTFLFVCVEFSLMGANPAAAIVERLLPQQSEHFEFSLDTGLKPHTFVLEQSGDKVRIAGHDQSAINAGLGHYFRHMANIHITDCGSTLQAPRKWPKVEKRLEITTPSHVRTAYNYCTYSYTFSYYDWSEWQREIDRIALNGVNVALVLPGHERVWQRTLHQLGLSHEEIMAFIPAGPFTAWWLMANLEGEGGPVSQEVIDNEAMIGRQICDRLRELGIEPLVNGFTGTVPTVLPQYIKAQYIPQGEWVGGFVRPIVLSPLDSEYARIASIWYDELHRQFGAVKYYGGDLFHEGGSSGNLDVSKCGVAMQKAMLEANPNAIYVLQGWGGNPIESMVRVLDSQHVLVQQLSLDVSKLSYGRYRTYSGRPWVLTEIGNFGGNSGMYGNLSTQCTIPAKLYEKQNGNVVGMGLTAEGFAYNPVVYDLWSDVMWSDTTIELQAWLNGYIMRRYGVLSPEAQKAWAALERSVYRMPFEQEAVTDFVMSSHPYDERTRARHWCRNEFYWKMEDVIEAAEALIQVQSNTEGWNYDMVDVVRQLFNGYALMLRNDIMESYDEHNEVKMKQQMVEFLELFDDLDALLATNKYFLLGRELARAQSRSTDSEMVQQLRQAHLQLYTIWSRRVSSDLNDYASRALQGLMKDYYKMRWAYYFEQIKKSFSDQKRRPIYDKSIDKQWYKNTNIYAEKPVGDTREVAQRLLKKYVNRMKMRAKKESVGQGIPCQLHADHGMQQIITVDVTNEITKAGKYQVKIDYKKGAHALKISKVELFSGDAKVAEDVHEGYSGEEKRNHIYKLNVKQYRQALEFYTIKIHCHGDGGTQWQGVVKLTENNE